MKNLSIFIFLLLLASCTEISFKTKRSALYKEVMDHYNSKETPVEQKRNAALFLFEQMEKNQTLYSSETDSILNSYGNYLESLSDSVETDSIVVALKEIHTLCPFYNSVILEDLKTLSSERLIAHINTSYQAWKATKEVSGANYEDYKEFILPYRIKDEYIDSGLSTRLFNNYSYILDTIKYKGFSVELISHFIEKVGLIYSLDLMHTFPNSYSPLIVDKIKIVPSCEYSSIYFVHLFRSLGIPATLDHIPQWGNHHSKGHSWFAIKWQGKWYPFEAANGKSLLNEYKNACIPKVFRLAYNKKLDVSKEYLSTTTVNIECQKIKKNPAIAIFNKNNTYRIIDEGTIDNNKIRFENMGANCIYFVGKTNRSGRFNAISNPIYIDSNKAIKDLSINTNLKKDVKLLRKYPLITHNGNRRKKDWAISLNNSRIEASNDNFVTIDTLVTLKDFDSYKPEYFNINSRQKYTSVRYVCDSIDQIAELALYNSKNIKLEGEVSSNHWKFKKVANAFDENPLTFLYTGHKRVMIFVRLDFASPQNISRIKVLARNDGNHIEIGDKYELLVWNNGWTSVGTQTAHTNELNYKELPLGGLYWLKDLTKGSEELPFMINADGRQMWPGEVPL